MINFYNYENEFVFTLPKEMQEGILFYLDTLYASMNHYGTYARYAENDDARQYCQTYYLKLRDRLRICEDTLELLKIYPAVDWHTHPGGYFFPTHEDCALEEEWYWKCKD